MKSKFIIASVVLITTIYACSNSKNDTGKAADNSKVESVDTEGSTATEQTVSTNSGPGISFTIENTQIQNYASILVTKDKKKLQSNAPYLCVLTSNAAKNNNEYLTINFLLDTKPGTYPIVGSSLQRGTSPNDEMYGGMLGGEVKMTEYKVNITECKDLGDNGSGGHKRSISGTCDLVVIKAASVVLLDKSKKHPEEVKIEKITFHDLSFDDNWEEMMNKTMKVK